jgi:Tol biopolymer transport system component
VPISTTSWQISKPPERLTFGTGYETQPSIAATGRLAFASLSQNIDVWSLPIDPNEARPRGDLQRLTEDAASDIYASTSIDGKRFVYVSNRGGQWDVWLRNNETGTETRLITGADFDIRPVIAASRVA